MDILRTPDGVADGLPDYPTERRDEEIPAGDGQALRVHLIDAGDPDAPVVVLLHGNPSWSCLWRRQIAAITAAGYRTVAPDLVGMGLSDKPSEMVDYTVARHVEWMRALLFDPLPDVIEAYRAPYPHPALTIGSRAFTQLLPTRPDNAMYAANHEAWKVLDHWTLAWLGDPQ